MCDFYISRETKFLKRAKTIGYGHSSFHFDKKCLNKNWLEKHKVVDYWLPVKINEGIANEKEKMSLQIKGQ